MEKRIQVPLFCLRLSHLCCLSVCISLPHCWFSSSIILVVCLCCCLLHVLVCPVIKTTKSAYTSPSFFVYLVTVVYGSGGIPLEAAVLGTKVCVNTLHTHTQHVHMCYNTYIHHMHMCPSSVAIIGRRYRSVSSCCKNNWVTSDPPSVQVGLGYDFLKIVLHSGFKVNVRRKWSQ